MFMVCSLYYLFLESFWLTDANFELHAERVKRVSLGEAYGSAQAKPL